MAQKLSSVKISKGDVIATATPFVFALLADERHSRCEQCFARLPSPNENVKIASCTKCGHVKYCSQKCHDESERSGFHRIECSITARRPLRNLTRLIARVLVRLHDLTIPDDDDDDVDDPEIHDPDRCPRTSINNVTTVDKHRMSEHADQANHSISASAFATFDYIRGYKRDWNCLMDHYEDIIRDPAAMRTFEFVYEELELIFDGSDRRRVSLSRLATIEQLIRIYGKILVNSFAIHENDVPAQSSLESESSRPDGGGNSLRQIGRAVYLGPSIFDHSCAPDAIFTFAGTRLYLIALRDLFTDDVRRIHISYIDEFETRAERRRQLRAAFYFDCGCERCESEDNQSDQPDEDETLLRVMNDKIEDFYANSHGNRFESRYTLLAQSKQLISPSIVSSIPTNFFAASITPSDSDRESESSDDEAFLSHRSLHQTIIAEIENDLRIKTRIARLDTILAVRIADFVFSTSVAAGDLRAGCAYVREIERLIAIYRRHYGERHPRLMYKIYHFAGLLLERIGKIYANKKNDCFGERSNLDELNNCWQAVTRLRRQAKLIRQFIDDAISNAKLDDADVGTKFVADDLYSEKNMVSTPQSKNQIEYTNRTGSYRDLLEQHRIGNDI